VPDFSQRTLIPEKMDQPDVAENEIHQALKELEIINKTLGGYHVIFDALKKIDWKNKECKILDLGCGGGDMLRAIARWARKNNKKVRLVGVDMNPVMTNYAIEHSKQYPEISFITRNIFDDELLQEKADITMNSLFCHHFTHEELVFLMQRMDKLSSQAIIINDLHRNWFAYYSIKVITRIFSKSYLVKYDAPVSVARGLSRNEWLNVISEAKLINYKIKWMWAWRWQIIIRKVNSN
jgi:ubiquinone/menaquinone biosynthesis C-methylase UbiE